MALYSEAAIIAEQNGYKQFLLQITIADTSTHTFALPTRTSDGALLPNNCCFMLQADQDFNYDFGNANVVIAASTNPGTLVLAKQQEFCRRSVNYNNPFTYVAVKGAAPGTLNIFYVRVFTEIPPPGGNL